MRKIVLTGAILLNALLGKAQFTPDDLVYYVGEGPDTAVLVIDFLDGTSDSSYAWGFLFDAGASVTGGDMLTAIAADEPELDVITGGGFLNNIYYNAHVGEGGAPNYWGTWSKTTETEWVTNSGLTEVLNNGDWFGCSYTDFDPAIVPGEPIPAYSSLKYTEEMVQFWIGSGSNSAVFVVDFISDVAGEAVSYAWGYRFDGVTDGATMLAEIDAADLNLSIDAGAFLNDILFNGLEGLAGDPYYWGTWSGTNLSDWTMNAGLATIIHDGDWFGCSYGDWPSRRPFYPISALDPAGFGFDVLDVVLGSGANKVMMVIDFNEWLPDRSYAFGYYFDTETITAQDVMLALEDGGFLLDFDLSGGFLNGIVYGAASESGLGGMPYYWSTWSATNPGGWSMNSGISEVMSDGDWFACSYTAWEPATPPSMPQAGYVAWGIAENQRYNLQLSPNPATTSVNFEITEKTTLQFVDSQGRVIREIQTVNGSNQMDVSTLAAGLYFIVGEVDGKEVRQKLVVK